MFRLRVLRGVLVFVPLRCQKCKNLLLVAPAVAQDRVSKYPGYLPETWLGGESGKYPS